MKFTLSNHVSIYKETRTTKHLTYMFIGHFAVGLAAKKAAPSVSLGILFMAAQFLDLLWPAFLLFGWEHVAIQGGPIPLSFTYYPLSHSLLMACVWTALFGLIYFLINRKPTVAVVLALCVFSHWVLDLLVHVPDLPLYPGNSPLVGFGLWNHMPTEALLEGVIFIVGIIIYVRSTKAINKIGIHAYWSLVGFLVLIHISNLLGPPPPGVKALAWVGLSQWLIVLWGYWIDKNRVSKGFSV